MELDSFHPILHKIETPIHMLNAAGAGGFCFGAIAEFWGNPKSGKSTCAYQTAQLFLEEYGDLARVLILDSEKSAHELRLRRVFGLSPGIRLGMEEKPVEHEIKGGDPRVIIAPAISIEQGASNCTHYMKQFADEALLFVIWDSITGSKPAKEWEETEEAAEENRIANPWAGGQMLRPRVIGKAVDDILAMLWNNDKCFVVIINQARAKIGRFGTSEHSVGGYQMKHTMHYSIQFDYQGPLNESEFYKDGTLTHVRVEKSKFMPSTREIPVFIYDTLGGRISPIDELATMSIKLGILTQKGGWISLSDLFTPEYRKMAKKEAAYRMKEVMEDEGLLKACKLLLIEHFKEHFALVRMEYEEREVLLDLQKGIESLTEESS